MLQSQKAQLISAICMLQSQKRISFLPSFIIVQVNIR